MKALGGDVAADISRELAEPLRGLRDRLGLVVDHLERYVATSTGPTPYPWRSLQVLRQDLAEAYLEVTQLARRVDELDRALGDINVEWVDVATCVELGLRLANQHLSPGIELMIDLGAAAPARAAPGQLGLVVARLVAACAASARAVAGSSLSVRIIDEEAWSVIAIADNGDGDDTVEELGELARAAVAPWGGTADAASARGQGCTFEVRLVAQPPDGY